MKQRQYNLDKTAYDLEKENKRFIWKFFTYLYFLLFSLRNFKEIYIMCGIIGFTGNLQAPVPYYAVSPLSNRLRQ